MMDASNPLICFLSIDDQISRLTVSYALCSQEENKVGGYGHILRGMQDCLS